jgi:hypothetical protein
VLGGRLARPPSVRVVLVGYPSQKGLSAMSLYGRE